MLSVAVVVNSLLRDCRPDLLFHQAALRGVTHRAESREVPLAQTRATIRSCPRVPATECLL